MCCNSRDTGVQTARGDGALVQPIMAKWLGDGWYMFQVVARDVHDALDNVLQFLDCV